MPVPRLANAQTRLLDVQSEGDRLHRRGIEIVTVFHDVGMTPNHFQSAESAAFVSYTENQYRRLASERGYACRASLFRGADAAATLRSGARVLARGAFPGIIVANPT